jgi:hypothetical protein
MVGTQIELFIIGLFIEVVVTFEDGFYLQEQYFAVKRLVI